MKVDDLTITIRAKDEVTPVLRRLQRRLWWHRWGPAVAHVLIWLLAIVSFTLGRITA